VDGIETLAGAGITGSGAASGGGNLSRGIGDKVTISIASTLEGVVEPNPMSDLVSRGASQVEVSPGTARKGRVANDDSVIIGVGRVVGREGGITEKTLAIAGSKTDGVEVECAGVSHSESVLHGSLLGSIWRGAAEPAGIQCPGDVLQPENKTSSVIVLIQDIDLSLDLGIRNVTSRDATAGVDNVEVNRDLEDSSGSDPDGGLVLCEKR